MLKKVRVFTAPGCVKCRLTFKALDENGIEYDAIDVSKVDGATEEALALTDGNRELPVVDTGTQVWSGFRYERISELVSGVRGEGRVLKRPPVEDRVVVEDKG